MTMKTPIHPGLLLQENIEALGLSISHAAKGLNITRQNLYNIINGKTAISPDMALRCESAFGGSAQFWLNLQNAYDLAQLRGSKTVQKIEKFVAAQL